MSSDKIHQTPEWEALNAIWKKCSAEQRKALEDEFRLLTSFIRKQASTSSSKDSIDDYGYLHALSPAARSFVIEQINRGEPNIYHSIMAVIENKRNDSPEEIKNYYHKRFAHKRKYVADNWLLVCEIFDLCWKNWQRKHC